MHSLKVILLFCFSRFKVLAVPFAPKEFPNESITLITPFTDIEGQSSQKYFIIQRDIAEKSQFLKEKIEKFTITITPSELPHLIAAFHQLEMNAMLKILLNGLCTELPQKSAIELDTMEQIIPKELFVPLLHCIDDNPPLDWNYRKEAIQTKVNLHTKCRLESNFYFLGTNLAHLLTIWNPTFECLYYIKENNLALVLSPSFTITYKNSQNASKDAETLTSLDLNIALHYSFYLNNFNMEHVYESLTKLPNLIDVSISCSKQVLDMSKFPTLPKLRMLTINNCLLDEVVGFFQKGFPKLHTLFLGSNGIESIPQINSMPNLQILSLSQNRIKNVSELLNSPLPELQILILDGNNIQAIPKVNMDLMPNLHKLSMIQNPSYNNDRMYPKID